MRQGATNLERIRREPLLEQVLALLAVCRGEIRATVIKNIGLVTFAMVQLFEGARGGHGWLSRAAIARCLPLSEQPSSKEQRLYRFLGNPRFTPEVLIPLLLSLVCGTCGSCPLPMVLDQTTVGGICTLLIGVVYEGRVLPVAFSCFTYSKIHKSQNILEHSLIVAVMSCFPRGSRPWLIMDRGYARVDLLIQLREQWIPFLVRAKKNVTIYEGGKSKSLGRFCAPLGRVRAYRVHYHSRKKEPLLLVIFHGRGYKEPWYLLAPIDTELTAEQIVDLYRRRMNIEQGFRDWKTHLGVRGLLFKSENPAPALTRLLLAFSLSYIICISLGASAEGYAARALIEIPRRRPRHGTRRTLSVLSIGILRLSLPQFAASARRELQALLAYLCTGKGLIAAAAPAP